MSLYKEDESSPSSAIKWFQNPKYLHLVILCSAWFNVFMFVLE